jgi:hypothetical protein
MFDTRTSSDVQARPEYPNGTPIFHALRRAETPIFHALMTGAATRHRRVPPESATTGWIARRQIDPMSRFRADPLTAPIPIQAYLEPAIFSATRPAPVAPGRFTPSRTRQAHHVAPSPWDPRPDRQHRAGRHRLLSSFSA